MIQKECNFSFAGLIVISSKDVNIAYAFFFEPIRFLNRLNMYNWQYKEWPNLSMELKVLLAG